MAKSKISHAQKILLKRKEKTIDTRATRRATVTSKDSVVAIAQERKERNKTSLARVATGTTHLDPLLVSVLQVTVDDELGLLLRVEILLSEALVALRSQPVEDVRIPAGLQVELDVQHFRMQREQIDRTVDGQEGLADREAAPSTVASL